MKAPKPNVKRLAKNVGKTPKNGGSDAQGKSASGAGSGGNAGGAAGETRSTSPLIRLIQSLGSEEIRFQIVGMTAAILQGVSTATFDTDIWVDLPERQYIRLTNLLVKQGATALAPTLYVLEDGRVVNFLFQVHGLRSFKTEYKNAGTAKIDGESVKVLPLKRILKSKQTIRRDKDLPHIPLIEKVLEARRIKSA